MQDAMSRIAKKIIAMVEHVQNVNHHIIIVPLPLALMVMMNALNAMKIALNAVEKIFALLAIKIPQRST